MEKQRKKDVVLIGGGIMSATLGTLLKELVPEWEVTVFEKLSNVGEESSNEWNNAGTGHAALCELNYTDVRPDGSIDISKAVKVNEQFQVSKQFWSFLVNKKLLNEPRKFIMELPHVSLVKGEENVEFLRKRFEVLSGHPLFKGMEYTDDPRKLMQWLPLIMNERIIDEPMAATKIDTGTDVNFGALTRMLFDHLQNKEVQIKYKHQVDNINRLSNGSWELKVQNLEQGTVESHEADFVFIGAGGGSLHLLQKSGIPEGRRIGGFPVSGLFLICNNEDVIERHHAKVYGKAPVGAPPMSVPHLDSRYIDGKKTLLFGPFAGFTPKFLKNGSLFDLTSSIKKDNISTMVGAGVKNFSLTKYLIRQLLLSKEKRMDELRQFIPTAKSKDWDLLVAGQRVQVIAEKGTLKFGTEVICAKDGSIAALLGASPGASTAVSAMLDLLERCFSDYIEEWEPKIREMIPSFRESLSEKPELLGEIDSKTSDALGLVKMDARL